MICRTCAAVLAGSSRFSATASASTSAAVRGTTTRARGISASKPPGAPRRDPLIKRRAADQHPLTVRADVLDLRKRADQRAALGPRQPGVAGGADHGVPEQPDIAATALIHSHNNPPLRARSPRARTLPEHLGA